MLLERLDALEYLQILIELVFRYRNMASIWFERKVLQVWKEKEFKNYNYYNDEKYWQTCDDVRFSRYIKLDVFVPNQNS